MSKGHRRELFVVAVVSSVVTALALGGGVAVALNVPNNSVNSAKIVDGTVRGIDIRNGAVADVDLSADSRSSWAIVHFNASGVPSLVTGEGATAVSDINPGRTTVTFSRDVSDCAVTATLHSNSFTSTPLSGGLNTMHVVGVPAAIEVRTYNAAGTPTDPPIGTGYTMLVNC